MTFLIPPVVFGGEGPTSPPPAEAAATTALDTGDMAWMLIASGLVMFMLPGLALFYAGMVRRKNVLSSMMHSFVALGVITLQWVIIGYSIAFGDSLGGVVGNPLHKLMLRSITPETIWEGYKIPEYVYVIFQGMFAIITPALISGALAERIRFRTYIMFIFLWGTLVYDVLAHWVWNAGGWLAQLGALDFAGGTVVHLSAGISALVAVLLIGKRRGYPSGEMLPHNMTMTLLGAGLLWFGWFGFNAGSAVASNTQAGLAFTTTHIASAAGLLGWLLAERMHRGYPSALGAASGIVAGLVAITPAAGFVAPEAAILIGVGAGFICYCGVLLKGHFHYDDSLDVFGVHGVGGMWGALATGLFATMAGKSGLIAGDVQQFMNQVIAVVASGLYAFVMTWILVKMLDATMGFQVKEEEELTGLDRVEHGEVGYNF
jgi:Amt family ammonium transporter